MEWEQEPLWAAPGMQAGVDYDSTPIDEFFMSNLQTIDTTIYFNLGHRMMYIDGVHSWVIIGTPSQGWMEVEFADNSEGDLVQASTAVDELHRH